MVDRDPDGRGVGGTDAPRLITDALPEADGSRTVDGGKLDGMVTDAGCSGGPASCVGDSLHTCVDGKLAIASCAHGCNAVRSACNTCKPNSRVCSQGALVICNADGTATTMMACASGCNVAANECNGCTANTQWCNGNVLRECTAAGMQQDKVTCANGCNSQRLVCNTCSPGAKVCAGTNLQTCRDDGSGWIDTACGPCKTCQNLRCENTADGQDGPGCTGGCRGCQNGSCAIATNAMCSPRMCNGGNMVEGRCAANGSCVSQTVQSCGGNGCTSSGCNECRSGSKECSAATARTCSGGSWTSVNCGSRGCVAGDCCPNGQRNCSGRCQECCEDAHCGAGESCQSDTCRVMCPVCNTTRRCDSNGNVITTERCNMTTGRCDPQVQNCGGRGCTAGECNPECDSDDDCARDTLVGRCLGCVSGICRPTRLGGVCDSGGGFCNPRGDCQLCGHLDAMCCPGDAFADDRCPNAPGCGNGDPECVCRASDNTCRRP